MEIKLRSSILQRTGLRVRAQWRVAKNSPSARQIHICVSEITLGFARFWFCGTDDGSKNRKELMQEDVIGICLREYHCSHQIPELTWAIRISGNQEGKAVIFSLSCFHQCGVVVLGRFLVFVLFCSVFPCIALFICRLVCLFLWEMCAHYSSHSHCLILCCKLSPGACSLFHTGRSLLGIRESGNSELTEKKK